MKIEQLRCALLGVSAYRHLMDEPIMELALSMLGALSAGRGEDGLACYTRLFYMLAEGNDAGLGAWLWDSLRYRESPYSKSLEEGRSTPALERAARADVETFRELAELDCEQIIARMRELLPAEFGPVLEALPCWTCGAGFTFEDLRAFYLTNGAGLFARYRAFRWEKGALLAVPDPDSPAPEEMIGYERQRNQVIANTRAMLEGRLVNHVLLYGDSGTGKSAAVKSLLSVPEFKNLRLIEIQKESLGELPCLIRMLAGRPQKFILFIDDLSFDQDDRTYSALKTILEGGLERRPDHVTIYATSNRRHLVRQTFSDRAGDEVDAFETLTEKTSLSERFGLRIPYLALNQAEFLTLVDRMAAQRQIDLPVEALHAAAVKWEARRPGKTPRTALQFIQSLLSLCP